MKNKEVLERLKKCFTNCGFPGGYEELVLTNEKELNSLFNDLLKDVECEEALQGMRKNYMKYYKMSTYGKDVLCPCCHRSCLEMTGDDYFMKHYLINDVKITKKACAVIRAKEEPKPQVFFDDPYTILKWGDFTTIVKCDEIDEFDPFVGLGIALYRYYRQHKDYKKAYQKLNYVMEFEELYHYALHQFCGFDANKRVALAKKLKNSEKGSWIKLDNI